MLKSKEQIQDGPTGISQKGNRNKRGGKWGVGSRGNWTCPKILIEFIIIYTSFCITEYIYVSRIAKVTVSNHFVTAL